LHDDEKNGIFLFLPKEILINHFFSKKNVEYILHALRKKIPNLEEKNATNLAKTENGNVNDDAKTKMGNVKTVILEEIKNNPPRFKTH